MRSHPSVRWLTYILSVLSILLLASTADAARVAGVKGKKLLIALDGEPAQRGDIYYLLDQNGKKRAIIKIMKIKGNKALALLGKGRAKKGMTLQARGGGSRPSGPSPSQQAASPESTTTAGSGGSMMNLDGVLWGFMLSFDQDSMDVNSTDVTASLSGSSMSYKAMFDYELFPQVWFRGFAGMENFAGEGPKNCSNKTCSVDISYLTFDFWGRYVFSKTSFRPWLGGGFSVLFPTSEEVTALDPNSVTNTTVTLLGGGFDYFMSETLYFPLQVDYGLFPTSDEVSASMISLRAGVGFSF